jgi:hypothetical protein
MDRGLWRLSFPAEQLAPADPSAAIMDSRGFKTLIVVAAPPPSPASPLRK